MHYYPLIMINLSLQTVTPLPLGPGYFLRNFQTGDETAWARIETAAGEFSSVELALQRFNAEFGPRLSDFSRRSLLLCTSDGTPIGTGTAWYNNDFHAEYYGRLHWIAIHPQYQGKGLAKPLVSSVLHLLCQFHTRAYLTTRTTSRKAIKIYRTFGFTPLIDSEQDQEAWDSVGNC